MADELDALLELAEEVEGADTATVAAQGHTATSLQQPDPTEEDPLLGLADAICHDQQDDKPAPSTAAKPSKVTICSTRAFSLATPGSTSTHTSSKAAGQIAHTSGAPRTQQQHHDVQHYVEKLTGLKIKLPRVSGIVLKERYRSITCVPVSKAQQHMAADGSSWVVIGVLVSKQIGTTHKGAPYSRWRVSDLAGSDALIALFGEAHKDHYAQAEGSVLAFYTPRFSSKGPGGSSSSSGGLAVSQAAQVELLATSAGWGFCRGTTKAGGRCSLAVDTTISHYCQYHALQQAKTLRAPVKGAAKQQQQQAAVETPSLPAASNGRVFDARSKTWSSGSCTATPAAATTAAAAGPGSRHCSSNTSSRGHVGSSSSSIPAGGFGSRSTSSNAVLLPITAGSSGFGAGGAGGSSGGGLQTSSSSSVQRAKAAAQQAELRESLKAKLQQQQQQQGSQRQDVSSLDERSKPAAGVRGRRPSGGSGGGFSLTSVMAAVSGCVLPAEEQQQPQQHELRWCPQQQQQGKQHSQQRQQQQHQQQGQPQRQQQDLLRQQPARQCGVQPIQQPKQQQPQGQQQQQQDGLDDLIDELFDDNGMDDEDDDTLVIQPAAAAAAAADAATAGQHTAQGAQGSGGDGGSDGLSSAAARAAAAMARLSGSRPAGGGSSSGGGNVVSTAAKITDARKRMKVALGLAPKSSLNGAGSSSSSKQGSTGPGAAKAAGAGGSRQAAARPHVSRIGAVGAVSVGAAAGANAGVVRSSSVAAAGAAGQSGAGSSAARAAPGSSSVGGSSAGGGAASGFRAMFGRVLHRADINKPDAKLLGAVSDAAHASMMSKLLNQYEQKDNLAQQLEGITKLEVTAFECRTCKFLTEKRRATCSGHDIVAVCVTKRWWICEACGWKLHTLRELMPSKRCPKCRDPEKLFRPTSAYNVPKPSLVNPEAASNPIASRESMLPRGDEHAFCLNSLKD